jgi:hypothetical protein
MTHFLFSIKRIIFLTSKTIGVNVSVFNMGLDNETKTETKGIQK